MSSIALLSEASYTCPWRQNSLQRNADLLLYSEPALINPISSALEQLDALQASVELWSCSRVTLRALCRLLLKLARTFQNSQTYSDTAAFSLAMRATSIAPVRSLMPACLTSSSLLEMSVA